MAVLSIKGGFRQMKVGFFTGKPPAWQALATPLADSTATPGARQHNLAATRIWSG
jgi:hypothetical protein